MQEDRKMTVRERILAATRRLSAEHDLEHLSFAQIAKAAGVSWATVRRYVGEKAHLAQFLAQEEVSASLAGSDTRSRILVAASHVFARKGYAGASLDEIAATIGLTKGAIYWHFANKSEILLALMEERRKRQAETLPEAIRRFTEASDPMVALTEVLEEQLRLCRENQEWPRLAAEFLAESRDPKMRERFQALVRLRQDIIRDALAAAQRKLRLQAQTDPFMIAVLLTSLFDGLQQWSLVDPSALEPETLAPALACLLWPGLAPEE